MNIWTLEFIDAMMCLKTFISDNNAVIKLIKNCSVVYYYLPIDSSIHMYVKRLCVEYYMIYTIMYYYSFLTVL